MVSSDNALPSNNCHVNAEMKFSDQIHIKAEKSFWWLDPHNVLLFKSQSKYCRVSMAIALEIHLQKYG